MLALYVRTLTALSALFAPVHSRALSRARGAGMLEYALLGGLAVFLFIALKKPLVDIVEDIVKRIQNSVASKGSTA